MRIKTNSKWFKIFIDSVLINCMVYMFIGFVLYVLPFKIKGVNPIAEMAKSMDYTDLVFSKMSDKHDVSKDVVVVNVDNIDREGISYLIEKVNKGDPKVIGLDVWFKERKESRSDSLLASAINGASNIVCVAKQSGNTLESISPTSYAHGQLLGDSLITRTIRDFSFDNRIGGLLSLSAQIVKQSYPNKYDSILKTIGKVSKINYKPSSYFMTYEPETVLNPSFDEGEKFKDKIVLIGFTSGMKNEFLIEDKHFTPMNVKLAGRSLPDMSGAYIHANIIQNLVSKTYIRKINPKGVYVFTVLVTILLGMVIVNNYVYQPKWFHFKSKIIQTVLSILFLFISLWIMNRFLIKLDFSLLFFATMLLSDMIYFYDPFTKLLERYKIYDSALLHH